MTTGKSPHKDIVQADDSGGIAPVGHTIGFVV
jgi:hypothetical protein